MVTSRNRIFVEYPEEWLTKVPFKSWVIPGIIAIILFGFGNFLSAVIILKNRNDKPWLMSAIMGGILLVSLIAQVLILSEWYLVTLQLLILSIIQVCLSGYVFLGYKKKKSS